MDTPGRPRHGLYEWTQTGAVLSLTVTEGKEQRCPRPSPGLLLPSMTTTVLMEGCRDQLGSLGTDPLCLEQRTRLRDGAEMPVYLASGREASAVS